MKNQQSVRQIIESALNEIRAKYGMSLYTIDVEWTGTLAEPACSITRVEFRGISCHPTDKEGQ